MRSPLPLVISGCSGGGKSTLLAALDERGWSTVPEPGRRVLQVQRKTGGTAMPWQDMAAFARACLAVAAGDYPVAAGASHRPTVLDRSAVDAATALERLGVLNAADEEAVAGCRYAPVVLMAPPWPELFASDEDRRHDFAEAVAEYDALCASYPRRGYRCIALPRQPVAQRVAFVEALLADMSG
jgi:predicted ATPase